MWGPAPSPGQERDRICFGTLDARTCRGRQFILVDYKTGFKVPAADITMKQLGGQATALMQKYPILTGGSCHAIFGRAHQFQSMEISREEAGGIEEWAWAMKMACEAATPDDINPGSWCTYCRARDTCPGPQKAAQELVQVENIDIVEPKQLVRMLDLCEIVEPMVKLVRARARNLLRADVGEFPLSPDGKRWQLKEKRGNRKVEDCVKAYQRISNVISMDEFLALTSVQIGKLENLFCDNLKAQSGVAKKDGKKVFEDAVGDAMRRLRGSTQLVKE